MYYFRSICTSVCSLCNPAHSWSRTAIWQRRDPTENLHTASSTRVRRPACDYCYRVLFRPLFSTYKYSFILGAFPSLRPALGPAIDRTRSLQLEPTARGSGFGLALPLKHPFTYIQQQKPFLSTSSPFSRTISRDASTLNPALAVSTGSVSEQQHRRRRFAILIVAVSSCSSSTSSTCRAVLGVDGDAEREYRGESVCA